MSAVEAITMPFIFWGAVAALWQLFHR